MNRVPILGYDDLEDYVDMIGAGEKNVLTGNEIIMLETTSGSSAPSKLIPYTKELKKQFNHGVAPWITDIYAKFPTIFFGNSYWSISPVNHKQRRTAAGIPIGFEEDNEYFGFFGRLFLKAIFAVPSEVKYIDNIESFRYVTMLFLLKTKNLALISVWNPSFLTLLLDTLDKNFAQLVSDLEKGEISSDVSMDIDLRLKLNKLLGKNRKRAVEIRKTNKEYEKIWPKLKFISCWKDAAALGFAEELQKRFPNVYIQGKGLLATEGMISIPYRGLTVLSARSHFFEFEVMDERDEFSGETVLAHETMAGEKYGVIITTAGGLYRYRLLDIVEVTGHMKKCPTLKFLGKYLNVSDLFGEKLNEIHVMNVVEEKLKEYKIVPVFYIVAPREPSEGVYVLYLQTADEVSKDILNRLVHEIDIGLCENFHYKYCRDLGQLQSIRLFIINRAGLETYNRVYRENGIREGDIKTKILHGDLNWHSIFEGEFIY